MSFEFRASKAFFGGYTQAGSDKITFLYVFEINVA